MSRSKYRPRWHVSPRGPRWWRRMTCTVPLRREAKRKLHLSRDLEQVILTKPNRSREYWW